MGVHSPGVETLEGGMHTCTASETLPFDAGDPEWVADLFDTLRAGDLDAVVGQLDEVLGLIRKATKARRMLATINPTLLREGLALYESSAGATR
jgi:hypothetical protein